MLQPSISRRELMQERTTTMAARLANRSGKGLFAFLVLFCLLPLAALCAQGQIPVTSCGTHITQPGDYILANDLTDCAPIGIEIDANMTLNLNGHNISGSGGLTGIDANAKYVITITGPGTVSAFHVGIDIHIGDEGTVQVTNVQAQGNSVGFAVSAPARAVLHGNTAIGSSTSGFEIESVGNDLRDNTASNNATGIFLSRHGAEHNLIVHNTTNGNAYGIEAQGSDNFMVSNTALNNQTYDLYDGGNGEHCRNRWFDNTFHTSDRDCIH